MTKTFLAVAAFSVLFAPAFAGSVTIDAMTPTLGSIQVLKRVVVKYDDLNPSDAQGAAALYDRINTTAIQLCTSNAGGHSSLLSDKVEQCRIKAVKQAVRDIGSAELAVVAAK